VKRLIGFALLAGSCTAMAQLPDIRPGDTCEKLRASYGKENSIEGPAHNWKQGAVTIQVLVRPAGPCVTGAVNYLLAQGSVFRTHEGILLGKDTMAEAAAKLGGRIHDTWYIFWRGEGKAYGQIEVPPTKAYPFKQTYSWQLNRAAAARLTDLPTKASFTTESANYYTIDPPDPGTLQ
jgi:hypothetical protein